MILMLEINRISKNIITSHFSKSLHIFQCKKGLSHLTGHIHQFYWIDKSNFEAEEFSIFTILYRK